MKKIYFLAILSLILLRTGSASLLSAQVLNPADPIVIYNSASPPAQPAYGQIGKWVITRDITSWVTDPFKAYIYKGMAFRLLYPRSYKSGVNDGKTYPLIIMFHGAGEKGTVYDNDLSLVHGGLPELNAENSGTIDAFVLHAQNATGYWGPSQYGPISELITIMASTAKVDPYRVSMHGLSAGGIACWDVLNAYPKLMAFSAAQSAADPAYTNNLSLYKYTSLWYSQGGLDASPPPSTGNSMVSTIRASGAYINYLFQPNNGHNTWDDTYANPAFFPYFMIANKVNPTVLFQKSGFCPGNAVSASMGVTAGFDGYQWRKNGTLISGATTNVLNVTDTGYYDVSIKNGTVWSYYSPIPAHIYVQAILPAPNIILASNESDVFPVTDSSQKVSLTIPGTFLHYAWIKTGTSTILDTNRIFKARAAGSYQVSVTLTNGCSSLNSASFTVVNAAGANSPPPATNVLGYAPSYTSVALTWGQNPAPAYNETGFEVYRSLTTGGPYAFAGITKADSITFTDPGLLPNTRYYYVVRAVNLNGASALTKEISVLTQVDNIPPTAPVNLKLVSSSSNSLGITWQKSTDNVGVYKYFIYLNGIKSYIVDSSATSFSAYNLTPGTQYTVVVRAIDLSKNLSPASDQVTAFSADKGLTYNYYTFATSPSVLPDFSQLTPVSFGSTHNTDISIATQATNFAFLWTGTLFIPVAGNYTFGTASDDGSKLFIDAPYSFTGTPLVNNDGAHAVVSVEGTTYLTKGPHKINVAYYQGGGGSGMQLYWKNTPIPGITAVTSIADSFFVSPVKVPNLIPIAPAGLTATAVSYRQINLAWTVPADSTHSLTGFEVVRSASAGGPYITIASLGTSARNYTDSTSLSSSTFYYYQIRSVGTSGQSAYMPATGLMQQYYTSTTAWANNNLPDFNTLTPVSAILTNNISIAGATQANYFAYKWTGTINIPATGSYTFGTASDDGSKLYIDQAYSFSAVPLINNDGAHGTVNVENTITLTKGRHTFIATYDQLTGGAAMSVYMKKMVGGVLTNVRIADSSFSASVQVQTKAPPQLATAPSVITLKSVSGSKLQLSWTDTTTVASAYQIYRSVNNTTSFSLLANITATKLTSYTFVDSSLYAGATYNYKVRATNITGASGFSAVVAGSTIVAPPILGKLSNISMRYGTVKQVQLSSSDPQKLGIAYTARNLPSFAVLKDYGDGTGLLTLSPALSNIGNYTGVIITASNIRAASSDTLSINVNNNSIPVIDTIPGKVITALDSTVIALHAVDPSAAKVVFSLNTLPAFIKIVKTGAFTASLILHPGLNDAGTYPVVVTATDSLGGTSTRNFILLVNSYVKNQLISINFNGASNTNAPAPFNNTTGAPAKNLNFPNLVNGAGKASTIGFRITSDWGAVSNLGYGSAGADYGPSTGNNSGIYPDLVEQSCWWTNSLVQTIQFYGMQANHLYDFTLYGATKFTGQNDMATFKIGSTTVNLDGTTNTANTVTIKAQKADSTGSIILSVSNQGGGFAFLNAIVLNDVLQSAGPPVAPTALSATMIQSGVALRWTDNAINETGYQVFRKLQTDSTFTQLSALVGAGIVSYTDSSAQVRKTYNYRVRAVNGSGISSFTNIAAINVTVKAPVIAPLASVLLKTDSVYTLSVVATDDSLSLTQVKLTVSGLPASAIFTDNGNGRGLLSFTPRSPDIGVYPITITATDANNLTGSSAFTLTVQDKNLISTFVNFNQTAADAALKPWNNLNSLAYAGYTSNNLTDQNGNNSGINLSFVNGWSGLVDYGVQTGNNSGVFPDAVLKGFYYTSVADSMRIQLTGLNPNKKYNLDMIGSWANPGNPAITNYTVYSTTITQDPANNSSKLVSFKGVVSDSKGNLQVKVTKATASTYGIINGMVITSYTDNGIPVSPNALTAVPSSTSAILLNWQSRSYNDQGFYILQSSTPTGSFRVIDSVQTGISTYLSTGLNTNTSYSYEIIAKGSTVNSAASNVATASTLIFLVRVNFNLNAADAAPAPWNNTSSLPGANIALSLNDEYGNSTGVVMSFARKFTDYNNLGAQTGNNSGVFPDAVLKGFYYSVYPDSSVILFSNLNVNSSYDLSPLASYGNYYWGSTIYRVGNRSVTVNPYQNTTVQAVFSNIIPDANGQIKMTVKGAPGASFSFINGLTLQAHAYNPSASNLLAVGNKFATSAGKRASFTVFPDPFTDRVTVKLYAAVSGHYQVTIYDYSGRLVYTENVQNMTAASYVNHEINLTSAGLVSGMYILNVRSDVMPLQTLKIIKH